MRWLIDRSRTTRQSVLVCALGVLCIGPATAVADEPFAEDRRRTGRAPVPARISLQDAETDASVTGSEQSIPATADEFSRQETWPTSLPSQSVQDDFLPNTPLDADLSPSTATGGPDAVFASRPNRSIRPKFGFGGEWLGEASNVEFKSFDAEVKIPTYPVFGPPPPIINLRMTYTDLTAPAALGLPGELYDYSFGAAWMRPINDRWMLRIMLNAGIATDGVNTSGDAWQFRGGFFAMYRHSPEWNWIFGALALGRKDLPAVPAVGAIWSPNPRLRFDLILPRPRISVLLREHATRLQWGYLGIGFSGGTWAYQRVGGLNDQLTYKDWRMVVGWELVPAGGPGSAFGGGQKINVEAGYIFSRAIEFESDRPEIDIDNTWMLRTSVAF